MGTGVKRSGGAWPGPAGAARLGGGGQGIYAAAMPRSGKGGRYHHGDLRAALIETAIELIGERGLRDFSLAEASRRLGVAVSAPYAHFSDRDALLAAVAVRGYELFAAELAVGDDPGTPPDARLAEIIRAYVRFAAAHRPLFEMLYTHGLDKRRHPELEAAAKPVTDAFDSSVRAVIGGDEEATDALFEALEASARGYAMFLLDGHFDDGHVDDGPEAIDRAAAGASRAALALIENRALLVPAPDGPAPDDAVAADPAAGDAASGDAAQ
jgi:AcrR family transcriptional regulator